MKPQLASGLAGLVFGLGLAWSQMIDPRKVLAFLDVAGNWDPSLALVLAAAVAVSFAGFRVAARLGQPLCATTFAAPSNRRIDRRLLGGAAIFGIGWGLAGYCPGPAVSALSVGSLEPIVFLAAMAAGSLVAQSVPRSAAG